jgi:hypothetical protein
MRRICAALVPVSIQICTQTIVYVQRFARWASGFVSALDKSDIQQGFCAARSRTLCTVSDLDWAIVIDAEQSADVVAAP